MNDPLSGFAGAVLGVIAGTIVGIGVAYWQARREDRYRFAADRRQTYARVVTAVDAYATTVGSRLGQRRANDELRELLGAGASEIDSVEWPSPNEILGLLYQVEWLASEPALERARALRKTVDLVNERLSRAAIDGSKPLPSQDEAEALILAMHDAKNALVQEGRREVGLPELAERSTPG